ncbi:MAG: hypothetical protein FDZ75_00515 [Actinobacteria bacterium]|nr:MAG: hypothetical protein FDZ75_00515 [Actinomycetota bacterium]
MVVVNLSPRNKLLALVAVAVVVVAALAAILVFPQFGSLSSIDTEIETAKQQSAAASTLLEQRRQIKDQAAVTDAALVQLQNAMPENPEIPSLIVALQDEATAAGVRMTSVKVAEPVAGASFVSLPLDLITVGTWADTIEFTQQLRKLDRQLRIVGLKTALAGEQQVTEAKLSVPPYYQVTSIVTIEAYSVPAAPAASSAPPAPAAQ